MSSIPSVTIIVTPRERFSIARRSFGSIVANTAGNHRVVYVAGGAPPDVREFLQDGCARHHYELVLAPDFLVPNVARNVGLAHAQTEYVAFLDNDVVVEPGWLDALVRCAEEEKADLVGPLCLIGEPAEANVHSFGGKLLIETGDGWIRLRERHHLGPICLRTSGQRLTRLPSDYSEFHCALVRRSVFERIGLLDEKICGAAEHIDLAMHLRAIGARGFAEPSSVVSYLPLAYTLGDLAPFSVRWSDDWHSPTMAHLAGKWNLAPEAAIIGDYRNDFLEKRKRCLLSLESPRLPAPTTAAQLEVAQSIVGLLDQMAAIGYEPQARATIRDAYMVAAQLFAGSFRASGRPFLSHLVGTASILAAYGANPAVLAAALHHASYAHGRFPDGFADGIAAMRRWLKRRVGETVEDLVFTYSRLQSDTAARFMNRMDDMPISVAHAILIRIANAIEDRLSGDPRYFDSAGWLRASNDLIQRWMPIFTAVSERLGAAVLADILRETCLTAELDTIEPLLAPVRPLNFAIASNTGMTVPLEGRNTMAAQDSAAAGPVSHDRLSLDPAAIVAINGGSVTHVADGVTVDAAPCPWAYSAYLRLPRAGLAGCATIEILLRVERGRLGVLVLEHGSSVYQVAAEQSAAAAPDPICLRFDVPAIEEAGDIVFRGWPHDGEAAMAAILSVGVVTACASPGAAVPIL